MIPMGKKNKSKEIEINGVYLLVGMLIVACIIAYFIGVAHRPILTMDDLIECREGKYKPIEGEGSENVKYIEIVGQNLDLDSEWGKVHNFCRFDSVWKEEKQILGTIYVGERCTIDLDKYNTLKEGMLNQGWEDSELLRANILTFEAVMECNRVI